MTPEETAAQWLEQVGGRSELPVDVDRLAEEVLGLDVQEHADLRALIEAHLPAALSGLLLPAQARIYVNAVEARRSPGRRRFTVAHELGHWHLHRDGADTARTRFCRPADIGEGAQELWAARRLEAEANRFAAALLMPADVVRDQARRPAATASRCWRASSACQVPRCRCDWRCWTCFPSYMRR